MYKYDFRLDRHKYILDVYLSLTSATYCILFIYKHASITGDVIHLKSLRSDWILKEKSSFCHQQIFSSSIFVCFTRTCSVQSIFIIKAQLETYLFGAESGKLKPKQSSRFEIDLNWINLSTPHINILQHDLLDDDDAQVGIASSVQSAFLGSSVDESVLGCLHCFESSESSWRTSQPVQSN